MRADDESQDAHSRASEGEFVDHLIDFNDDFDGLALLRDRKSDHAKRSSLHSKERPHEKNGLSNSMSEQRKLTLASRASFKNQSLMSEDYLEYEARERKKTIRKEKWRRIRYQSYVMASCLTKYFVIALVEGEIDFFKTFSSDITDPSTFVENREFPIHLTFLLAYIVAGNLIDNVQSQKAMIVTCDICLGLSWIVFGLINRIDKQEDRHRSQLIFYWICITQIFAATTILLNVLQIYNWFSFRRVSLMLAVYFLVDLVGKYIQDAFAKNPFFRHSGIDFIFGVVFVICGVVDYFTFCFQPAALNVYID